MAQTESVVEINGRRYNISTGMPVAQGSIDGFVSSNPRYASDSAPAVPTGSAYQPQVGDVHRTPAHHAAPHHVQHSRTLMRHSVSHPDDAFKRHLRSATHTGIVRTHDQIAVVPKLSVHTVDPTRLARAKRVARSGLVRRFAVHHHEPAQEPQAVQAPAPAAPVSAPVAHQPSQDIFERALAVATSHEQTYTPTKRKKKHPVRTFMSFAAALASIVLIAGFVAYQNSAMLQLRLTASRAGVHATYPAWQPSGFHLGAFSYSNNALNVSYKNAGGQTYTITQTPTTWDSDQLLTDYVYPNNESYDTVTAGSQTIYTYGQNNATWVSGGVLYKLVSDGSLSTSQVVNIATSMQS